LSQSSATSSKTKPTPGSRTPAISPASGAGARLPP
jgi:hypothetical protein